MDAMHSARQDATAQRPQMPPSSFRAISLETPKQNQSTRFLPSWPCRLVAGEPRNCHTREDRVLPFVSNGSYIPADVQRVLTIEAGMRTRQSVLVAVVSMDVEPTEAVHTFELLESVEWDLTRTRNELQ